MPEENESKQRWLRLPWRAIERMAKETHRTERQVIELLVIENLPAKYAAFAEEAEAEQREAAQNA